MPKISEALGVALAHHQAARLDVAEEIYRRILAVEPEHAAALHGMGLLAHQRGHFAAAVEYLLRATGVDPSVGDYHNSLGIALQAQGKFVEAAARFRWAIAVKADYAEAYKNLGDVLLEKGKVSEALDCEQRAVELKPDFGEAHNSLANALKDQGDLEGAIRGYRRAAELLPERAEILSNLGAALHMRGKVDEAIPCYQRALHLQPNHSEAHNNLGVALQSQGRLEEAAASFRRAVELKPNYVGALGNLGNTWLDLGQPEQAVTCYRRALALAPNDADVLNHLGRALHVQEKLDAAIACFEQALRYRPGHVDVYNNLGNALRDAGQPAEAIACCRRAVELDPGRPLVGSSLLYGLQFSPEHTAPTILDEHRRWNEQHAAPLAERVVPHANKRSPERRLRIGYVSPDFRRHAESFFTVPLFAAHDHRNFEIFAYSAVTHPDRITARIRSCCDTWRSIVGVSDEQVAARIRADEIDILVDLTMHMAGNRLLVFARKPAPIQACWLAYQGTTGLSAIDYRLTDPIIDPPGMFDPYYAEESLRLADSFWCYDPLADGPAVGPLPALNKGRITFGCLNNFCKVNAPVLKLWAEVLKAVDRSQLMMLAGEGRPRNWTLDVLEQEGVSRQRVSFLSRVPRDEYLALHHQFDLALDTLPYHGQTTTFDALWMGVPVVTLVGQTAVGRAGLSILSNLGLPELVAHTPEQYVRLVAQLAGDLPRLAQLRATLRERLQRSPLMDAPRFARNVETAYRTMWRRWCQQSAGSAR